MHFWVRTSSFFIASAVATTAFASIFPDVPDGHIYQVPVEQLSRTGVIDGNPDGNFYPDRAVNRAEMLKLLYGAKGLRPESSSRDCFSDVESGSWYESFVCDAAVRKFVSGYSDRTFRPAQEVNKVEALKMIQEVFGINVDDITEADREVIQFVDVSVAAWYTKYLFNAFEVGILPIAGQNPSRFYPEEPLKRGQAAAMIFNALYADIQQQREDTENDDQEESEEDTTQQETTQTPHEDEEIVAQDNLAHTTFPIDVSGKFDKKKPFSYYFDIASTTVVSTEVELQNGQPGDVSCVLYLKDGSGFANEYYLGIQEDRSCHLLTTLEAGSYQLQIQPTQADTTYTVVSESGNGDGNDGFSEAKTLLIGTPKTETLQQNNMQNWYTYTVNNPNGLRLKLDLTNSTNLRCVIYAMDDVDIFGFEGPACGQYYMYPPGTYYFAVSRKLPRGVQQTYTILLSN